jgi:rhodanese-related sulfurtransferase
MRKRLLAMPEPGMAFRDRVTTQPHKGHIMPQTITRGVRTLLAEANTHVRTMTVAEAKTRLKDDAFVFVDLRDIREIQRAGLLPGAFCCPRGMLEFWIAPDSPYHKPVFNQDKTYVFYCASAWRSALGAKTAMDMGLAPVLHLAGGFTEWVKQDGPVEARGNQAAGGSPPT